jgi:hypothetical protein
VVECLCKIKWGDGEGLSEVEKSSRRGDTEKGLITTLTLWIGISILLVYLGDK